MTREERFIEMLGGISDALIAETMPGVSADSRPVKRQYVKFTQVGKIDEKELRRYRIRRAVTVSIAAAVMLAVAVPLLFSLISEWKNRVVTDDTMCSFPPSYFEKYTDGENVRFAELLEANSDTVGWISIGAPEDPLIYIDYPVVQGEENTFYAEHNFLKEENPRGSIYADCNNVFSENEMSDNTVLYGSNMWNGDTMFGGLSRYHDGAGLPDIKLTAHEFYEKYPTVRFDTIYGKAEWQIFACMTYDTDPESNDYFPFTEKLTFADEADFNEYIARIYGYDVLNTGVDVRYGDKLLTLTTQYGSKDDSIRLVVFARKARWEDTDGSGHGILYTPADMRYELDGCSVHVTGYEFDRLWCKLYLDVTYTGGSQFTFDAKIKGNDDPGFTAHRFDKISVSGDTVSYTAEVFDLKSAKYSSNIVFSKWDSSESFTVPVKYPGNIPTADIQLNTVLETPAGKQITLETVSVCPYMFGFAYRAENTADIDDITDYLVIMKNGEEIPVFSRRWAADDNGRVFEIVLAGDVYSDPDMRINDRIVSFDDIECIGVSGIVVYGSTGNTRFEQITDTSMPVPFSALHDHDHFDLQWNPRLHNIPEGFYRDGMELWEQRVEDIATPFTLYDCYDLAGYIRTFVIDPGETEDILRKHNETWQEMLKKAEKNGNERVAENIRTAIYTDEEISALKSGDETVIIDRFISEYAVWVKDFNYVLSPMWLYYHTAEDYRDIGITPQMIAEKLPLYEETYSGNKYGMNMDEHSWKMFSAKLKAYITENVQPQNNDPFEAVTDVSMPSPFPAEQDYDHFDFESQWRAKFIGLFDDSERDGYQEWLKYLATVRTPYTLYDNNCISGSIRALGYTAEETEEKLRKHNDMWQETLTKDEESGNEGAIQNSRSMIFSDREINALKYSREQEIISLFISEYSIWVNEKNYVISPQWLYYHTTEDYEAVGITPQMIAVILPLYEKTFTGTNSGYDMADESWELFRAKLSGYAEKWQPEDRLAQKTDAMPEPFMAVDSPMPGTKPFYRIWKRKFEGPDGAPYFFFDEAIFPDKNTKEYQERLKSMTDAETPYTLGNSWNDLLAAKALGLTDEELRFAINKRNELYLAEDDYFRRSEVLYDDEDTEILLSGDSERIVKHFASDLSIVVGENVFSPQWLYYHLQDDYRTAGITPEMVKEMLPVYEETFMSESVGMLKESWDAFRSKLIAYAYKEEYTLSLAETNRFFRSDLFEKAFYGKWEPADGSTEDSGILLTYRDDMFTFEKYIYPCGIAENDEIYVMPYVSGGVGECYIVKKSEPGYLYKGWWNMADKGILSDWLDRFEINSVTGKYKIADRYENDREIKPGDEIGVWGMYKLMGNSLQSLIFTEFCNETGYEKCGGFSGKGGFTDESGLDWIVGSSKALSLPCSKMYYIGGDGSYDLELAVRYYAKKEFEMFVESIGERQLTEPTGNYFVLRFELEAAGGAYICNVTHSQSPFRQEKTDAGDPVRGFVENESFVMTDTDDNTDSVQRDLPG